MDDDKENQRQKFYSKLENNSSHDFLKIGNIEDCVQRFKNSERVAKEKTKLQQYYQATDNKRGTDDVQRSYNGPDLFPDDLPLIPRRPQNQNQKGKEKLSPPHMEELALKRKTDLELFSSSLNRFSTANNNSKKNDPPLSKKSFKKTAAEEMIYAQKSTKNYGEEPSGEEEGVVEEEEAPADDEMTYAKKSKKSYGEKNKYILRLAPASYFPNSQMLTMSHENDFTNNVPRNKDFSSGKEKFKLRLAPASHFEDRIKIKRNTKKEMHGGLKPDIQQPSNIRTRILLNQNENITISSSLNRFSATNNNSEYVANNDLNLTNRLPGAYAVRGIAYAVHGIDADRVQSYESFITYNNESSQSNSNDSSSNRPKGQQQQHLSDVNAIIADIVDDNAEREKIIGDFIKGTKQAHIVKKKPFCRKRNILIGVLGLFIVATITIGVEFLTRESDYEKLFNILRTVSEEETLREEKYPQGRAFRWLLEDKNSKAMSDDDEAIRERYISALLYFSTGGGRYWTNEYGFLDGEESVCQWNHENRTGITCTEEQRIFSISMVKNNLTGTLPSELSALSNLEEINLGQNKLNGTIPSSFSDFSLLKELRLSSNLFHGSIPSKIFNLNNLIVLRLENNALTGTIPTGITQSQSLDTIDLSNNQLSGTIPGNFNNILRLKGIFFQSNQLTGTIPETFSRLAPSLKSLNIESNKLDGKIPITIGDCKRLRDLWISNNTLSGTVPSEIGRMMDLELLNAANNKLTGGIPTEIGQLSRLKSLQFTDNELNGTIPSELGRLKDLTKVDLEVNALTGTIPTELNTLTSLGWLHIYRNNLVGSIGKDFCESGKTVRADCAAPNPEIEISHCQCCFCYNDDDPILAGGINYYPPDESICDNSAQLIIMDNLLKNDDRGEVSCGCADTSGLHIRCHESSFTCNIDESFCVRNLWFQVFIKNYDDLFFDAVENKVQYIAGSNNSSTIEWGSSGWLEGKANKCWVRIDGQECKSCVVEECINGKNSPIFTCENIIGGTYGGYNGCDERESENLGIFNAIFMASNRDIVNKEYSPILDPMNPWHNFYG